MIEMFCENKVAWIDNFTRLTLMAKGKKRSKKAVLADKGHKSEMKALVESIKAGKASPIPFESIYATMSACFKIREPIKKKKQMVMVSYRP